MVTNNRLICAIDSSSLDVSYNLAKSLVGHIGVIKLGLEFFTAQGIVGVKKIQSLGLPIFLDVKLHDIPTTIYKTLQILKSLELFMLTIHLSGGPAMIKSACEALEGVKTIILGVTILTSLSQTELNLMGLNINFDEYLISLAKLGVSNGLHGLVCAGKDLPNLRQNFSSSVKLIVPGIRDIQKEEKEHKRSITAREAINRGADYIVVGRPITQSSDPVMAAKKILSSIE